MTPKKRGDDSFEACRSPGRWAEGMAVAASMPMGLLTKGTVEGVASAASAPHLGLVGAAGGRGKGGRGRQSSPLSASLNASSPHRGAWQSEGSCHPGMRPSSDGSSSDGLTPALIRTASRCQLMTVVSEAPDLPSLLLTAARPEASPSRLAVSLEQLVSDRPLGEQVLAEGISGEGGSSSAWAASGPSPICQTNQGISDGNVAENHPLGVPGGKPLEVGDTEAVSPFKGRSPAVMLTSKKFPTTVAGDDNLPKSGMAARDLTPLSVERGKAQLPPSTAASPVSTPTASSSLRQQFPKDSFTIPGLI